MGCDITTKGKVNDIPIYIVYINIIILIPYTLFILYVFVILCSITIQFPILICCKCLPNHQSSI